MGKCLTLGNLQALPAKSLKNKSILCACTLEQTVPGILYFVMLMLQDSLVEHFANTKPVSIV